MNLLNILFPKRAKRSHLKNLIAVAYSDGTLDPKEAQVLAQIAHRLGIDDTEIREIIANHRSIRFSLPRSNRERIELLWDYICLVIADGRLEARELRLCEKFCQKIELRTGVISSLIRKLSEWGMSGMPLELFQRDFTRLLGDDSVFKG